jgi:hypothetical protein
MIGSAMKGPAAQGGPSKAVTNDFIMRLISTVYFLAFLSLGIQVRGLIGVNGLIPLKRTLSEAERWLNNNQPSRSSVGMAMTRVFVMLMGSCADSDKNLDLFMRVAGLCALLGVFSPHPAVFLYLYVSYFCLKRASGSFMNLQWDSLLLESGLICALAATTTSTTSTTSTTVASITNVLFQILLFRLMFGCGYVKVVSRDTSWRDLTAMQYHFLTQPLPSTFAPLFHNLPSGLLKAMTVHTLVVEVVLPIVQLCGQTFLHDEWLSALNLVVAANYIILQAGIFFTGNYGKS